jgi:hypothetical protein
MPNDPSSRPVRPLTRRPVHDHGQNPRGQAAGGSAADLEPDARVGVLAQEFPALRDLVDELKPASALVL